MSALPPATLREPDDLSLETFEQIVWEGRSLHLHPALLARIASARDGMMAALADGRAVYGVTTGMGYLAAVALSEADQRKHQANLLLGRAVGGPPFLAAEEARAVLLARLAGFLSGHAGVTPALCEFLAARLNDGFTPAIPRGRSGSAGEIIPLAHAFQTLIGVGSVLGADGEPRDAIDALAERRLAPYIPEAKEGIALLAGAPGALALAIAHRRTAAALSRRLLVAAACAIDAIRAPLSAYDPAVADLCRDPVMARVLDRLNGLLAGSGPERHALQAPVSFRVVPQVLGHLERTLDRLEEDLRRGLIAVTDSPAFHEGRFVTSGGFHAVGLAAQLDSLAIALVQAAELAGQHIHRLLDHRFTGLPDQLTPLPGLNAGLVSVHKRVAGTVHELRGLAGPTTIGLFDTSMGQEDAMTFAFEAAEKLRRVEALVQEVAACELLVCRQAWALRGIAPAPGLQEYVRRIERAVQPVENDRPLGADISALIALLNSGAPG